MIVWQDPPPYVQYVQEAEALARMTYAAGNCDDLRYRINTEQGDAELRAFIRRAAIDRVGSEFAEQAYEEAVSREDGEWKLMLSDDQSDSEEEAWARMVDGAAFLTSRCALAAEEYPSVIVADGDEARTAQQLVDLMLGEE